LGDARKAGELVLVEGESDCWTLWYQGFPALGLPGAEMAGIVEESILAGIDRLYILQEPDSGGITFVSHLAKRLAEWRWSGRAFVVRLSGAKDPNELYKQDRKGFRATFQQALEQAEPLSVHQTQPASVASSPISENKPAIFNLRELLSWELPPVRWAVSEILPEGLTLLAGKPKLGKSWLALSMALSIATGGVALGKQPVAQGDVLYLALEENARRLQARARQLLASMTEVPHGLEFALDWPRLAEGGLSHLEEYLKTHPNTRLVVVDTWAKVAPRTDHRRCTQYEGDYEALTPLKRLADAYHVSILAVHHLRKTSASDVLDEITGSTGMTGAVDGTLILKRERGQAEATLFVTGRDIEREQQLTLSFDASTALWSVIGNADELGRTRARQQILDLLREQPEGMSPREIAEALEKNYHTTRSILRKMEETGEVRQLHGRYLALSAERVQGHMQQPSQRSGQIRQGEYPQTTGHATSGGDLADDHDGTSQSGETDYGDYADYTDYGNDNSADSFTKERTLDEAAGLQEGVKSTTLCKHEVPLQEDRHQQETAVISVINIINRNQCNQLHVSDPQVDVQDRLPCEADQTARAEQNEASPQRNRCPHHPRAQMVRFDPAGQAWCDRLDCWDCYRLMKIGEALGYPHLTERGGKQLIEQGMEAWSVYVLTQRAFLVTWATQEALALCRALDIEEPELSGEVKRMIEVQPLPP